MEDKKKSVVYKGYLLSVLLIIPFYFGCTSENFQEFAKDLPSKIANHPQTLKAFEHYKGKKQKLAALYFILKNMDQHYAMSNILKKEYDSILSPKEYGYQIPNTDDKNGIALKRLITMEKKYAKIKPRLSKIKYDVNYLDGDYLIKNIDLAFKVWKEAPWYNEISFTNFCETILPYRADQEPLHNWRQDAYKNFHWVTKLDSIDRTKACSIINDSIGEILSNMIEMKMYPERLTYQKMHKFKLGICEDETAFATLAMRGVGLPVGIDFVPQWPWRSMGHSWNYLLLKDGSAIPFMGTESNPGIPHFKHEKKGKVYRKTFSKQSNSLAQIEKNYSKIPKFFRSPYFKDVTHLYTETHNITFSLESSEEKAGDYVYLSVFDNQKWEPIDWSIVKNNKATFKNIEGGIVYLPKYYKNGRFITNENPVILNDNGKVIKLSPNFHTTQTLTLKRKYPLHKRLDDYLKNMVGGRFELSNHANFNNSVILGTLNKKPEPYLRSIKNTVSKKKYKYIRYVSSKKDSGRCNLAIFNVFDNRGQKLKGKVIGSKGSYKGYGAEKEKAFDNNPASFFDAKEEDWGKAWIGLEFETSSRISKINFMPRNDTNTIFEGQEYELFYWDKGWHGLGKKIADISEEITFDKVPTGALYLLHNHSGGKEERIFTWENEHIKWY